MEYFTLTAGPNTDLWRKPPNGDTSTAPIVFTSLRHPFVVAEVTVSADWEMEWDQGGLVIFAGAAPGQSISSDNPQMTPATRTSRQSFSQMSRPCKWVKAGMEFCSDTMNASSVSATADGADWCLSPLPVPNGTRAITSLRIKLERVGHSLWIWYQIPSVSPYATTPGAVGSTWKKLREVTWFFYGVEDKFVHVGVYASRPTSISRNETMWETMNGSTLSRSATSGTGDGLVVEFEDLEIF
jgi:regulation of enolase protein 1 (concanavalin A-like superfamily)